MTTTLTTEQREIDLVRRFADGTPLSPKDFSFGQANHLLFVNAGCGCALTEYGRSLLNGMQPPGDSASCPDEDSYWPPSKATVHQPSQEARAPATQRRPKPAPLMCNPTPPEASALDVQEDMVNHPPHYKQGAVECIDAIKAALTEEEYRGYCKGNALKYIWRERHKGGAESLQKAKWYLNRVADAS